MKKFYAAPDAEITKFIAAENLTASGDDYIDNDAYGDGQNPDGNV